MSNNQKQSSSGQSQQQPRFAQGPYQSRAPAPQRTDGGGGGPGGGYHVSTPPGYVQQQQAAQQQAVAAAVAAAAAGQSGGPGQGAPSGGMRAMSAPSGPPNQSSTPPQQQQQQQQNELKQMQQQQSGQIPPMAYVPGAVRSGNQGYFRTPPPPNQATGGGGGGGGGGARMTNHHRQVPQSQPHMYQTHMPIFQSAINQPMTYHQMPMQYANAPRAQPFFQAQSYPALLPGQFIHSSFPTQQSPTQTYFFQNPGPMQIQGRQGPSQTVVPAAQVSGQAAQGALPLGQALSHPPPPQGQPAAGSASQPQQPASRQRPRAHAIPIINPDTGKRVSDEDESLPPSGDSSARETPQPAAASAATSMQVVAEFAARVAIVASEGKEVTPEHHESGGGGSGPPMHDYQRKIDSVLQNSKLQVSTKEFVPEQQPKALLQQPPQPLLQSVHPVPVKEPVTPVVSANADGIEVTITSKVSREPRDSPIKSRKQQQQPKETVPVAPIVVEQHHHGMPPGSIPSAVDMDVPNKMGGRNAGKQTKTSGENAPPVLADLTPTSSSPAQINESPETVEKPELTTPPAPPASKGKGSQKGAPKDTAPPAAAPAATPVATAVPTAPAAVTPTTAAPQTTQVPTSNAKPTVPAPVPASQPPKQSSKANKMREMNLKGANKEGTDMDAFAPPPEGSAETNNIPVAASQPEAPAEKDVPEKTVVPPAPAKPEVKIPAKMKVDVTSIVKDMPKPLKPAVAPAPPAPKSQDEVDRSTTTQAALNDKLVQAKNEANMKTANDVNNDNKVIDKTLIRYQKDQWSPINTEGKRCYGRDLLIGLQNNPNCQQKPTNLPDLEVVLKDSSNRARMTDARAFNLNRQTEVLMPAFHRSLSRNSPLPKHGSQQGKTSSKSGKSNMIHVTLSLREDVKLRETENAWKPQHKNAAAAPTEDEAKTASLYKKVRGVLNKLTPEKFDRLLNQVKALEIDTEERLQGVINLVFEKAVDEPNFSVAYADMCKHLAMMQVMVGPKKDGEEQSVVNFRKLLINRCQVEFEKQSSDEIARKVKVKEIEECTDPERKKELQLQMEEQDRRIRVKSVGNVRFIGELFKQHMLTSKIMIRCIMILLENKDEDSLECLCKLLTTIGADLESKNEKLDSYFGTMKEIVNKKHGKISSRVRFMLQDVIDLRNSNWVPRRTDLNPRTMGEIQKEADSEQLNIQVMNSSGGGTPRKDDRMGMSGSGSDRKRRNTTEDGWSTQSSRNRGSAQPYTVETSKLMNKPPPMENMRLGSRTQFAWGSNFNKSQVPAPVTNKYAALADNDKNRSSYDGQHGKEPYMSKGPSMERNSGGYKQHNYDDGRGSRSGSQHRSYGGGGPAPKSTPMAHAPPPTQAPPVIAKVSGPSASTGPPLLSSEKLELKMKNTLDELSNDCYGSLKDCVNEIKSSINSTQLIELVKFGYNYILERSSNSRILLGKLFAQLIKEQMLPVEEYCKAMDEVLAMADELVIDIPKLWDYMADVSYPLVSENALSMQRLCESLKSQQGQCHKLLVKLLRLFVKEKGPNYALTVWQSAGVTLEDFMPADAVPAYVKDNGLEFLTGGVNSKAMVAGNGAGDPMPWETVHDKLLQLIMNDPSFDTINDWIQANVGERSMENQFIRVLVSAVCEGAVVVQNGVRKLRAEVLRSHYPLLRRYIDYKNQYELQCLLALQALVHKWEHPPSLLFSIFERLWEDSVLSNESFIKWETCMDPAEQEGKGVALKSVQNLFIALKEADDEESTSDEDPDPVK